MRIRAILFMFFVFGWTLHPAQAAAPVDQYLQVVTSISKAFSQAPTEFPTPEARKQFVRAQMQPLWDAERVGNLLSGKTLGQNPKEQEFVSESVDLLNNILAGILWETRGARPKPIANYENGDNVEFQFSAIDPRGQTFQFGFRTTDGKAYDLTVLDAWVVETYRPKLTRLIKERGIEGALGYFQTGRAKSAVAASQAGTFADSRGSPNPGPYLRTQVTDPENNRRASQTSGACPDDLSYLDSTLPHFNYPQLEQIRQLVISEQISDVLAKIRSAGLSISQGAAEMLKHAKAAEMAEQQSLECVRQVSTEPDQMIARIKNGTYEFGSLGSIQDNCAASVANNYYSMVGTKELALAVACHAAKNR